MTELMEGIAPPSLDTDADAKCEFKPDDTNWKCKLDGDADVLARNITKHRGIAKPKRPATLADVSSDCWLYQAHHLIPHVQLKSHQVSQWLSKDKGTLNADNDYSVDHGNNGKFMPYAAKLPEWAGASTERKREIAEKVMAAARIQLHQGPHSYQPYGVGEAGYKTRVREYLAKVNNNSLDHYSSTPPCKDCEPKAKKGKPPRRNVVRAVDRVSRLLDGDIVAGRIFVSRRAADFVAGGGVL